MSKSLPVYELSQWVRSDRNIGYVVARMSAASVWEVREDYKGRKDVERFQGRGAGYVVQWVELNYEPRTDWVAPNWTPTVIGSAPRRLSWLRAETIAEKRYQPCENPVKAPVEATRAEEPVFAPVALVGVYGGLGPTVELPASLDVRKASVAPIELGQAICAEDTSPALSLDIEARWCGGARRTRGGPGSARPRRAR